MTTTNVVADSTYSLVIASGPGSGNHSAGVWFDFNHDGDFSGSGEYFHISDSIPENSPDVITSIAIPYYAFGITRMRVRYVHNTPVVQSSACDTFFYGETEDYSISIINNSTGVTNVHGSEMIIFPSPAHDHLTIRNRINDGEKIISIFDHTGRLCSYKKSAGSEVTIDVSRFSRGLYFICVEGINGRQTQKVILN